MSFDGYPMTELLYQAYKASAALVPSHDGTLPDETAFERYDALMSELERRFAEQRREASPTVIAGQACRVASSIGTFAETRPRDIKL